ncbi:intraflagellar transport protein 57 homolog [Paramacrobiotus metropolitanus]|uniref:intraflagellar transport protein 57 homolog n=1 Tax=Paramacrobiotus metropolitanus TaxID=2943436 RepID=UPI002445EDEA|nr:intraflagellar transport protein 57 homolog [Paramacrobiotus metropolitanus]XP_055338767.1 intraflagellar transport protein 57 homolog [Paramacrobiotus metropolitanus]
MAAKPSRRIPSQDKSKGSAGVAENAESSELTTNAVDDQPVPSGDLHLNLTRRSPGAKYLDVLRMERLLEKLVLLDYNQILQQNGSGMANLPRNYFLSGNLNAGTMTFQTFATLAVWMIGQLGIQLRAPEERDDPNLTVTSILESLRKLAVPVETTSHRLRSGSGSDVIAVLYELATACLKQREEFRPPVFPEAVSHQEDLDEEGLDGGEDAEDFHSIPFYDWEQEEVADAIVDDEGISPGDALSASDVKARQKAAEEWQLEADRVAPFFGQPDRMGSDRLGWSDRIKRLDVCWKELDQNVGNVSKKLLNVSAEMGRSMEKLRNREKFISVNNKDKIEKYRIVSAKLAAAKAKYEAHNTEVETNAQKLADVTAEVDKLKRQLEAKSNSAADRLAITSMRAAMKRMKEEIGVYNIRSAIAEMRLQELAEDLQNAEIQENLTSIETVGILPGVKD